MKKRMLLLGVMLSLCLTGCKKDNTHAIVEVKTSEGYAMVGLSLNGLGKANTGSQMAKNYPLELVLQKDETVSVHFYCDTCGHDESLEFTAPEAKMLSCDCPEDGDENNNAKEYVCIIATTSVSE